MPRRFGGIGQASGAERYRILIVVGLFFFVILAGGVVLLTQLKNSPAPATTVVQKEPAFPETVEVLVPVQNIEPGAPFDPNNFRKESRRADTVTPTMIRQFSEIAGQYARIALAANEPFSSEVVTSVRPINTITTQIPEGFRAVTISVNSTTSVEGFALPGARVDVVWVSRIAGKQGVTIIVQNAKVLSAERNSDGNVKPGTPVPSTITLLVSSDDATKIQLAQTTGSLSLSLRGDTDPGKGIQSNSITVDDLLNKNGSGADVQSSRKGPAVRVRRPDGGSDEFLLDSDGNLVPSKKSPAVASAANEQ